MAGASGQETARTPATFTLESLDAADGRLVISGHWSGVRGMRFVRPALVLGARQLLATLEHKPWAPDADPWVAAFPWESTDVDPSTLWLSVAPSVTVPLGGQDEVPAAPPVDDEVQIARLQSEVRFLREERRDENDHARREAERQRDNALAQAREAVEDREAAIRTRARMETQRDEALEELRAMQAERDDALAHLSEMRAHLDQALLANRELQQQLKAKVASAEPDRPPVPVRDPEDDEEPIGTRLIPAARAVSPALERAQRARDVGASTFDIWAIRVLGTVAAICFILLLVMFLGLFL